SVGKETGDDLAGERPDDDRAEEERETARHERRRPSYRSGKVQPDERESGVDETAVQVRPRAIRRDRPGHRRSAPERKSSEEAESEDAEVGRSRPGQISEKAAGDTGKRGQERESPDPEESPVVGAAAEEERGREEGAGHAEEGEPRGRPHCAGTLAERPLGARRDERPPNKELTAVLLEAHGRPEDSLEATVGGRSNRVRRVDSVTGRDHA